MLLVTESGDFFHESYGQGVSVVYGNLQDQAGAITGLEAYEGLWDHGGIYSFGSGGYVGYMDGVYDSSAGTPSPQTPVSATVAGTALTLVEPGGSGSPGVTSTWTYDATDYEQPSSLALVAGIWHGIGPDNAMAQTAPTVLAISADGVMFEQDPASGCVINGQVSLIDPSRNAYAFQFSYANCTDTIEEWAPLNGAIVSGIGYLTAGTPTTLTVGGAFGFLRFPASSPTAPVGES